MKEATKAVAKKAQKKFWGFNGWREMLVNSKFPLHLCIPKSMVGEWVQSIFLPLPQAALNSLEDQGMSACTIENKHFIASLVTVRPSLTQSQLNKYKDLYRWKVTCLRIAGHCQAIIGTISAQQIQRPTNMSSHRWSLSGHHWHNLSSTSTKTCTGEK